MYLFKLSNELSLSLMTQLVMDDDGERLDMLDSDCNVYGVLFLDFSFLASLF